MEGNEYAVRVGERLRNIRRQKGLSLQEVEAKSTKEFKASVLGAYERGERSISVPRLARLAEFYGVSVDQLLPRDDGAIDMGSAAGAGRGGIAIDLQRLEQPGTPELEVLRRYLARIQVERGDFNGKVLTIRADDLRALGCLFDLSSDELVHRLEDMGLRHQVMTA